MSTRAGIAVKFDDQIRFTTVSTDGYPRYMGNLLVNVHSSDKQAKAISNLGDLRTLGIVLEYDKTEMDEPCDLCGGMIGTRGTEAWTRDYGHRRGKCKARVVYIDKWQYTNIARKVRDFAYDCDYVYYWDGKEWRILYSGTFVKLANSWHLKAD